MEEDIKILEDMLNDLKERVLPKDVYILKEERQALENLLTRYKQLEEKLDNSRKANELLNKTNNELRWEKRTAYSKAVNDIISKFNLGDDYIPKSKIKEKIEELNKNELLEKLSYENIKFTIEILQSLL